MSACRIYSYSCRVPFSAPKVDPPTGWRPGIFTEPRRDAWSRRRVTSSAASDGPVDGAPTEPPRARARAVRPSHCGRNATSARRPHQLESTRWMRRCRGGSSRRATRRRRRVNLQGRPTAAWHLQGDSAIAPNAGGRGAAGATARRRTRRRRDVPFDAQPQLTRVARRRLGSLWPPQLKRVTVVGAQ